MGQALCVLYKNMYVICTSQEQSAYAALPSSTAWHATCRPCSSCNCGTSSRQRALASGQRGWKTQPGGGFSGDGSSPISLARKPRRDGSATGEAASSALV